ncbi:MAG: hypothetical protein ACLRT4_17865 [Thomasclavelia sp.]
MKKKNVFSDNTKNISILVYTENFLDDCAALNFFCNANKLRKIQIYFMPVLSKQKNCELILGEYSHFNFKAFTNVVISFKDCSGVITIHRDLPKDIDDKEIYKLAEDNIIHGQLVSDMFDYVVTKKGFSDQEKCDISVISLERCKEVLRLFLVQRKEFWVREHYMIDETFYYIYKHKQLFLEFQNYWHAIINKKETYKWASALDNRLCMITICLDQCKIEAYKRQNNATAMHLKYHISYLLLLITGTFDNLAWIINNNYQLKLNRKKIDLRNNQFKNRVKDKSMAIYNVLEMEYSKTGIDAIRELRDCVVHRDFIKTVMVGNSKYNYETNCFWLNNKAYNLFVEAGLENSSVKLKMENNIFIDVHDFINFLESRVVNITNKLLKIIADEIYDARDTYEIWKILKLPVEPYIL